MNRTNKKVISYIQQGTNCNYCILYFSSILLYNPSINHAQLMSISYSKYIMFQFFQILSNHNIIVTIGIFFVIKKTLFARSWRCLSQGLKFLTQRNVASNVIPFIISSLLVNIIAICHLVLSLISGVYSQQLNTSRMVSSSLVIVIS